LAFSNTGRRFRNSKQAEKFDGPVAPADLMTVGDYLDKWLDRQKLERKASTYDTYRKIVIGKLDPWFGKLKLSEMKRKHVRERLATYPPATRRSATSRACCARR
jgi:integrase